MEILGIDIGGSGIKGALVNVEKGELLTKRYRISTPDPSVPDAVGEVVAKIVRHFEWTGPIGCTFPAVIKDGVLHVQAGAGVVADSVPEAEHQECHNKARALLRAAEEAVKFAGRGGANR